MNQTKLDELIKDLIRFYKKRIDTLVSLIEEGNKQKGEIGFLNQISGSEIRSSTVDLLPNLEGELYSTVGFVMKLDALLTTKTKDEPN